MTTIQNFTDGRMYIGGQWRDSADGATLTSIDPSSEEEIGRIPDGGAADVDAAVEAALEALDSWRSLSPSQRGGRLVRLADRLEEREREFAELDAIDSGNPVGAMVDDVRGACRELRMFAGLATEIKADTVSNGADGFAYGMREPYGVVGRIVPFNHPLKFAVGKTAAALVAGNTIVLKPSEHTSLSAILFAELSEGILPPGVFNVVTGRGATAGAAIAAHPAIHRVAFTGGVPACRAVLRAAAENIKHVTAELGGKNPMIVYPDVNVPDAAKAAVKGMNLARSQGQSCMSTSRIFVHRDIEAAFTEELLQVVRALRVGHPLDPDADLGPLSFREHYERVLGYIDTGRSEGATLVTGGASDRSPGLYVDPTVFTEVTSDMTIARDEIFGPVMSVIGWTDEDAMLAQVNESPFGLTANIWTNDLRTAHRTAHRVESGYVWINGRTGKRVPGTPFGGYKESGLGKEGCLEEILEYTRHKIIDVALSE